MKNLEIKSRIANFDEAEHICERLGATCRGVLYQTDTYFNVSRGRFKLRVCEGGESYLVYYQRPDQSGPKISDYLMADVPPAVYQVLEAALGVIAQVRKTRTLYLWENVRIHLDRVETLGEFLEFEAVQAEGMSQADEKRKVQFLMKEFGIEEKALLASSYLDMILEGGCK